jgi:hypothetical protein
MGDDMKKNTARKTLAAIGLMLLGTVVNLQAAQYDHEIKDNKMSLAWKVDGTNLAVKMAAETEGWVGIGFNPSKDMKDADFILGYVKDGKAKISDEFGDKENSHALDKKLGGTDDAILVGGSEEGGVTTIEFTIPLKSVDKYDTTIKVDGDTKVLLAYGAGRDSFISKHVYRAELYVNLATGTSRKAD